MDNVGNRTRMTYADGDYIDYTYDELYRLTDETRTGTTSYSQQFTYDAVGNRTDLVESGEGMGQTIDYTYNAADQLLQVDDLEGPTTSYTYDDNGNMTQTTMGEQDAYYYYDFDNRLVSINRDNLFFADATLRRFGTFARLGSKPGFTKRQFFLRADSADSLIKAAFWVWTSGFGFLILAIVLCELPLLLYRLKYCRQRFDCVSAWPKRYSFFEKCLICLLLAFSFVLLNPETEVAYALPTSQAKYTYAPDGARIEKDVDGAVTKFIYDRENAVAEYDDTNPPQMNLLATYVTPSTDFNISKTDTTGTYFYTHDGLGSVRQLLDSSETTQNDYDYNAIGGSVSETDLVTNEFKYTGRRFDPESGIYYYRARYYDAAIGRLLQKDPLFAELASLALAMALSNLLPLYVYTSNNPVNNTDPSGLSVADKIADTLLRFLDALLAGGAGTAFRAWLLSLGPIGGFIVDLIQIGLIGLLVYAFAWLVASIISCVLGTLWHTCVRHHKTECIKECKVIGACASGALLSALSLVMYHYGLVIPAILVWLSVKIPLSYAISEICIWLQCNKPSRCR